MSSLSQFFGGGLKSFQTGYVSTTTLTTGTGEDVRYVDVTVSSVDTTKCFAVFEGGFSSSTNNSMVKSGGNTAFDATVRLTSSTNLRISTNYADAAVVGRWKILEFK